jgi:signal transduction histidine kinase
LLVQLKGVGENIAHDLRAPLAVMRARLERGVESSDDRELRVAARQAVGDLDKAMVTVAALLRIAQVESGPSAAGFAPIDLAAICADLFEFYEPLARAKSIAITLEVQSPVETMGDGDLMREALSNLIDNAIKFTPEGGAVRLSATMEAGRATIRVSDNGFGVAPGERDKIFERFYRTAGEARIPGSGIGLSLSV